MQVHTDHGSADIYSCVCLSVDRFYENRIFESLITNGCKSSAGMIRLRNCINLFKAVFLHGLSFNHKCSVEVLAALRCHKNTFFLKHGNNPIEYRIRRIQICSGSYLVSQYLT